MVPSSLGRGVSSTVRQRARAGQRAVGNAPARATCCSWLARLTSRTPSFSRITRPMATTSSGVLFAPKITSGKPHPRARSVSTRAKPRSTNDSAMRSGGGGGSREMHPHRNHLRLGKAMILEKALPFRIHPVRQQRDACEVFFLRVFDGVLEELVPNPAPAVVA